MIKKVAVVIALVIVAPLIAGCINIISPSPTPTPVPTPVPTTTHNPVLESVANRLASCNTIGNPPVYVNYDQHVTWNGGNIVTVFFLERDATNASAIPLAANYTFMAFSTTKDASKYIDSIDKSQYVWETSYGWPYLSNGTSRASVYQKWYCNVGPPISNSGEVPPNFKSSTIQQFDNIVELESDWAFG